MARRNEGRKAKKGASARAVDVDDEEELDDEEFESGDLGDEGDDDA